VQRSRSCRDLSRPCRFNPHRLLGVGATPSTVIILSNFSVSILTDSWESVQLDPVFITVCVRLFQSSPTPGSRCNAEGHHGPTAALSVSILTDSWESVQRMRRRRSSCSGWCFNPHRLLGVGATRALSPLHIGGHRVSILTDSWESVQPMQPLPSCSGTNRFNPHRLLGVGATWYPVRNKAYWDRFQSSPTPGSRCNTTFWMNSEGPTTCFNPHRLLGVGATHAINRGLSHQHGFNPHRLLGVGATKVLIDGKLEDCVSILTDSWESVQLDALQECVTTLVVSILTDSWESVQLRNSASSLALVRVSILTDSWESVQRELLVVCWRLDEFQSSPTPGSRCNPGARALHAHYMVFQSSPTPGSRCN